MSHPVELETAYEKAASVDGWVINIADQKTAIEKIIAGARRGEGFTVFTLNLDHLVKLRASAEFRDAYERARYVTADGAPVAKIARRQWRRVARTSGSDLFLPLCMAAAEAEQVSIYLFGTSDEVLEKTVASLSRKTLGRLRIAGWEAPPSGFDPAGPAAEAAIRRIERSGARLCFVMLGAPKQELFATRAVESGLQVAFVCVGAAADFIAGRHTRAPSWVQSLNLEWLWRLFSDPRRLAIRYLRCAVLLALMKLDSHSELRGTRG